MVRDHEIYRIYQCPRCKHMEFNAYEYERTAGLTFRHIGKCKGKPVKIDPQYGLLKSPPNCKEWSKGKAKKVKYVS